MSNGKSDRSVSGYGIGIRNEPCIVMNANDYQIEDGNGFTLFFLLLYRALRRRGVGAGLDCVRVWGFGFYCFHGKVEWERHDFMRFVTDRHVAVKRRNTSTWVDCCLLCVLGYGFANLVDQFAI